MNEGSVAAQVEVPVVGVDRQSLFINSMEELLEIVLALRSADDLALPLRRETIVAQYGARIGGILLHVERLRALGVIHHEHGPVEIRHE